MIDYFSNLPARPTILPVGSSRHAARHSSGTSRHLVHVATVTAHASGLDNPAGNGGNGEVADDADEQEHDVHPVARIQREVRVCLHPLDVALQHQHLYLRQYGAEHVRHRQPQIDLYVAAYPLRERALETVPHRYGEGYRTEYRQHHEEEGADGVYHEGGGLEQQFQYLAEEVADVFLHVVHPRSIYIPAIVTMSEGDQPSSSSCLSNSSLDTR